MGQLFRALWVEEKEPKNFVRSVIERDTNELPEGDLLIRVRFSSLNYKDALSASGNKGVTRRFPHTPGIDAVGEVVECGDGSFQVGDTVLVTGRDLGMNTPGGFGQYIRVPSSWALPLPAGLKAEESMMLGTAGLTAGLSVQALLDAGMTPERGDVLVTGATGGVGSLAIPMLKAEGFRVVAATGKESEHEFLKNLGADEVVSRASLLENADRPLMSERWGAVVDCVGGSILAAALKSTAYGGAVTCCGLVASPELNVNVFPFILRGVSLFGIDSVEIDRPRREQVWGKLAGPWKPSQLEQMSRRVGLDGLEAEIDRMLKGQARGRVLVDLDA